MEEYLPAHLKHLEHSKLFRALDQAVSSFRQNKVIDDKFLAVLVKTMASEFEKACDHLPVSSRTLDLQDTARIANYRFDRGYWELVIPDATIAIKDSKSGTVLLRQQAPVLSIQGSGGGLRKGKRKTESIKRAHTRQVARDSRREDSLDDSEFSDDDWEP
jgi:hypothetical protein